MFSIAFVVAFLVTLSLASPAIVGRQTSLCQSDGISSQANFTLLAVSKSDINVQKPLALGLDTEPPAGNTAWIATEESMNLNSIISTNFNMSDGGITSFTPDGIITGVSNNAPQENGFLPFTRVVEWLAPTTGVYCILVSTDPHGVTFPLTLAVNGGDSDNFWLCQRSNTNSTNEVVVVYKAVESSSASAGYNYGTCTEIAVAVLPVDQQ